MGAAEARWFHKHQAVESFRQGLAQEVYGSYALNTKGTKRYTTAFGYTRFFFSPYREGIRELFNFPMQANAAGLMNDRFVKMHAAKVPLCLQMHDEGVAEVPEKSALFWARRMRDIMSEYCKELKAEFPVDIAIGKDLGNLKEVTL